MKLSEKTLELNICAQVSTSIICFTPNPYLLWFGLTQKQEARAGFDACTKLGGRLLVFQFKASNRQLQNGMRRFLLPHGQLEALQRLAQYRPSHHFVFVAFPLVGTTSELQRYPDLLEATWLLNVASPSLKNMQPPSRRNGCHNVYVAPGSIVLRSEPVAGEAVRLRELINELLYNPSIGIDIQPEPREPKPLEPEPRKPEPELLEVILKEAPSLAGATVAALLIPGTRILR